MRFMRNLADFDRRLRELAEDDARPFLCQGDPYDCSIFLVGLNPRTRTDFWPYWSPAKGCAKDQWLAAYRAREKKIGPTRKRIELLFETLAPELKCLETNLFDAWSQRLADLPKEKRSTRIFDFLLDEIRPKAILAHGRAVVEHLEKLTGQSLRLDSVQRVKLGGQQVVLYPRHHLSFQLSEAACRQIGVRLKRESLA
jgi:hypothetical protein